MRLAQLTLALANLAVTGTLKPAAFCLAARWLANASRAVEWI